MTRLLGYLLVMVAFPAPFPTQDTRRLQPPHWPRHLGTPALLPLGLSPASFPHRSSTYSTVFPVWGGQALISPYLAAFQVYFFPLEGLQPFPRVKASVVKLETFSSHLSFGLKLEPRSQHRRGKRSLSNSIVLSLGDKPKPFLTHGGDRKAIPRLKSH